MNSTESTELTLPELPDGLHPGVPEHVYHAPNLGFVSKGSLDKLARSPAHYKAWIDGALEEEATPALAFGSAFHCALLEPERFDREYVVEPVWGDCRKKDNKAARDAWRSEHEGVKTIDASDEEAIYAMAARVRAHPLAGRALREGDSELTALWTDEETGLRCRARADYYVRELRMVVDVKTTEDARPEAFGRSVFNYHYHRQHALYRMGFASLGERVEHFVFVAVEKKPPFEVGVFVLDDAGVRKGYHDVHHLMLRMRECTMTNEWPGYPTNIQTIETPPWAA